MGTDGLLKCAELKALFHLNLQLPKLREAYHNIVSIIILKKKVTEPYLCSAGIQNKIVLWVNKT